MPQLGLVMIVRDEEQSLPATLAAVKPLISHWTIVDTGSVDRTRDVALEQLDGIPGRFVERGWEGFAAARNQALELARGRADYHLMLDADLIVEHDGRPLQLDADAYLVELAGDFRMSLPLITRDGLAARYVGAAHAYLDVPAGARVERLRQLRVRETRSSSPRASKIQDDARLLESEISPRTIFYLAQSLRDLGHKREAADLYRFRVRLSADSPQDVFWACYQEGLLRLETDGLAAGAQVLLEAWERRPSRAEPLWKLARAHRLAGLPRAALMFAEQACRIPDTTDEGFVLAWVYEWGCLMELALAHLALGQTEDARAAFLALTLMGLEGEPHDFAVEQLELLDGSLVTVQEGSAA
jgi:hypothetical protein